jgi:hypothetical protein
MPSCTGALYGPAESSMPVSDPISCPPVLIESPGMLETVLFAPLRFHDTTSRGRLLNRFGKDIEGLDSEMADHCKSPIFPPEDQC